jgi:y4mF family transcriptional regulator
MKKNALDKIVDALIKVPTRKGGLFEPGQKSLESGPKFITSARDLGGQIKTARRTIKLSQEELADLVGVGRRFISELENGKPSLEFDKVILVAKALGIDLMAHRR